MDGRTKAAALRRWTGGAPRSGHPASVSEPRRGLANGEKGPLGVIRQGLPRLGSDRICHAGWQWRQPEQRGRGLLGDIQRRINQAKDSLIECGIVGKGVEPLQTPPLAQIELKLGVSQVRLVRDNVLLFEVRQVHDIYVPAHRLIGKSRIVVSVTKFSPQNWHPTFVKSYRWQVFTCHLRLPGTPGAVRQDCVPARARVQLAAQSSGKN